MDERFARLGALRAEALNGRDPTASDETLACMLDAARSCGAENVLEIGAGKALTAIAFALALPKARVTAIERDVGRIPCARENIAAFGVQAQVSLLEGDAADILPRLDGEYDLIFLDAAKVQYRRFLPDCKRLLRGGGWLFSDDVLLFADGVPKKRKMLARHIGEYLSDLKADAAFETQIYPFGKGLAASRKRDASDIGENA